MTNPDDPIACLIDEPRIYYLSERPAACPLLRTQDCYRHKFAGLITAVRDRRPKVVLARIPRELRGKQHEQADIRSAILADLESHFGPPAVVIRDHYQITDVINSDVCILQPKDKAHPAET